MKEGYKFSEEHKQKQSEAIKKRWQDGVYDSPEIRQKWRDTALANIAKKGTISPKRYIPSDEMIEDFSRMGDQDMREKWGVSLQLLVRLRKRYGIKSFLNPHGTVEHKTIDGVEYKLCQHEKHWKPITEFGRNKTRWDGLRGWCKDCEKEENKKNYYKNDYASRIKAWSKTESGRKSKRETWYKATQKKKGVYVKFEIADKRRIYEICNSSCAYCGTPVHFDDLEFDHFVPVKLGGLTEPSNMLPSCTNCNRGRGGKFYREPQEWLLYRFGKKMGQEIYDKCVSILTSL